MVDINFYNKLIIIILFINYKNLLYNKLNLYKAIFIYIIYTIII